MLVVASFLLVHIATGSRILVDPPAHQFRAINSTGNVTLTCNVTGGNSFPVRDAVWEVQQRQIQNDQDTNVRRSFADIGVFVEVLQAGVTDLTITSGARLSYLNENPSNPNITVLCSSFSDSLLPSGEEGDLINITTFRGPLIPTALSLNPNPEDGTQLVLSWKAPAGSMDGVMLTYTPTITGVPVNSTMETFVILDEDLSLECLPRNLSVFASNDAGNGPVASITETIPISPNITSLDRDFQVTQVSLGSPIVISLSFPPAQHCNSRFPILNYSLSIPTILERIQLNLNAPEQDGDTFVISVEVPGLVNDGIFEAFIETCVSITCRQSGVRVLRTTDIQGASIVFFENNIFVTCTFASGSNAMGCIFQLQILNASEIFSVSRSGEIGSQCHQTQNQRDAYVQITASDLEANADVGTQPILIMQPTVLEDAELYTRMTGCVIPEPAAVLSAGAVAGIVIAVLIVAAVVIVIVVLLLVYRVRTGQWFKLREKNEEKLTVYFEKELLMGEVKPRKKSKVSATFVSGRNSPDSAPGGKGGGAISAIGPAGSEEQDAVDATNPNAAFTLDISSDRKKVRLHLNRALIRRVLHDRKLNTMDRRRARRQNSMGKQHLVPLHCEVRVQVDEDQEHNSD